MFSSFGGNNLWAEKLALLTGEDPNQTNNNSNQVQKKNNDNNQQPPSRTTIPDRLPPLVPATNFGKNRQFHKNNNFNQAGNSSRNQVVNPQGHINTGHINTCCPMGNQRNNVSPSNLSQTHSFVNNFLPSSAQQQSTPIKPKMEAGYDHFDMKPDPKMENYGNNFQKLEYDHPNKNLAPKIESISKINERSSKNESSFPKMEWNSLPKIDSFPPMNNGSPEGNPSILRHSSSSSFPDSGINGLTTTQYFNPVQNVLNTSYHTPNNYNVINSSQNCMITPQTNEIKQNKTGPGSSFDIDLGLLYNMNQNCNDPHMSKMNKTPTKIDPKFDSNLDSKFDSNNGMPTLTPETGALVPWKPDEAPAKNEEIDIFKTDLFKNDIFKSDIFKSDLFSDQLLKNEPLFKNDFKTDSHKNETISKNTDYYPGMVSSGPWSKNTTNQFKHNNNLKNANQFNSVDEILNSNFPNFNPGTSGQPNFNFSNNFFSFPPHPSAMDNIKNEFQAGSFGNYHPNQHGFPQVNVNIFNSTQTVPNLPTNMIPNVGLLDEATTSSTGQSTSKQQTGQSNAQQNHHHNHHPRQNQNPRNTQNNTSNNGRQQQNTDPNHHQNNPQRPRQSHHQQPFSSSAQTSNVNFQQVHVYQQFNFPPYHQNFPESFSGQPGNSHHHNLSGTNPFNSSTHTSNTFFHPFGLNSQMQKKNGDGVQGGRKHSKKMKKAAGQKAAKIKLPELQQNDGYYPYVKKYKCQELGCGKAFRRSDQLKRHHLCLHTNERPWICNFPNCNSKFGRSDHLQSHQKNRKHREEDPIPPEYQRNLPVEQKKLM